MGVMHLHTEPAERGRHIQTGVGTRRRHQRVREHHQHAGYFARDCRPVRTGFSAAAARGLREVAIRTGPFHRGTEQRMTDRTMQIASGCVTSVSQTTISTKVWSNNLGWTTQSIEEIALQLDTFDALLTVRTDSTRSLFIVAGDRLTVAYARSGDRARLYGIRNVTDGSVYLVRTAQVAGARTDTFVTIGMLCVILCVTGILSAVQRSTDGMLDISMAFGATAIGFFVLSAMLRAVFGVVVWPEIRRLKQPGGRREMNAAKHALSLANTETRNIRFL
ncbi:hypothetical protein CFB49_18990 [Burkholderia sp. AU17457]|nr:hypothetical protein CFB49_18990 [Burkholderia sp. AU17457]